MRKLIKSFIGITMTFATRIEGQLMIQNVSFLIRATSLSGAVEAANKIGKIRSYGNISAHEDFVKYIGLSDIFGIVGSLGHGAMMGQTSKFSYKNILSCQKMLPGYKEFTSNQKEGDPAVDDLYLVRFVFFLGKPVPYKSRRALVCWGVVKSHFKSKIVSKAKELGKSNEFKRKITLRDYDERFSPELLQFVGIANIIPIFEKLKVNSCFLYGVTYAKSTIDFKKVILPNPKEFKGFFEDI